MCTKSESRKYRKCTNHLILLNITSLNYFLWIFKLSRLMIDDKKGKIGFKEYKILTRYDNKVIDFLISPIYAKTVPFLF